MQIVYKLDPAVLPNVTAAREAYNATLPLDGAPGSTSSTKAIASNEAFLTMHLDELVRGWIGAYRLLPPAPPPAPAVPQEVQAVQAHMELIAQGLHHATDPLMSEVEKCLMLITDSTVRQMMYTLFHKSNTFQRNRPELLKLWTDAKPLGLGRTPEQLDQTFINASKR